MAGVPLGLPGRAVVRIPRRRVRGRVSSSLLGPVRLRRASLRFNSRPPRRTPQSGRLRVSDRTMVPFPNPCGLLGLRKSGRPSRLTHEDNHAGYTPSSRRSSITGAGCQQNIPRPVSGEVFLLTSPFIEQTAKRERFHCLRRIEGSPAPNLFGFISQTFGAGWKHAFHSNCPLRTSRADSAQDDRDYARTDNNCQEKFGTCGGAP